MKWGYKLIELHTEKSIKRILHRCQIPYFTARGWALLAVTGILGGIMGGILFVMVLNSFSK
jgi:hypothetical protein